MVNHPISWVARLYVFLLLFTLVAAIARFIRLAWSVSAFSVRKQVSKKLLTEGLLNQSLLATAALSNNFEKEALEHSGSDSEVELNRDHLLILEHANVRFRYLWRLRMNDVGALRRSVYLIILASAFVTFDGVFNVLRGIAIQKGMGVGALSGGLAEIGLLLSLGFGLATAIYLLCIWFQGMLLVRKNRWNYFVGRTRLRGPHV